MIVTVTGYKGGIGKTTTALHLAAYLQQQAPAVLVDGDLNRSATGWGRNGSLPFRVVDERQAAKVSREFEHIVIDTAARPVREDLEALVAGCDHLIIPTTTDALALDALVQTVGALEALGATNYRVLLTIVQPAPSRDGDEARASLAAGKSADPDYQKTTVYLRKQLHRNVKIACLKANPPLDMSDVVEQQLADWLKTQNRDS